MVYAIWADAALLAGTLLGNLKNAVLRRKGASVPYKIRDTIANTHFGLATVIT